MNITKEMREDFANAVIRDIPRKQTTDLATLKAAIEKLIYATVPDELKAWKKKEPRAFKNEQFGIRVPKLDRDGMGIQSQLSWEYVYGIQIGDHMTSHPTSESAIALKAQIDKLIAEYGKYLEETVELNQLREELVTKALGARTLKQLQAMFPKLTEYMPVEKTKAVVVFGEDKATLDKLKKAGLKVPKVKELK